MSRPAPTARQRGVTLLELAVVVLMLAAIASVAVMDGSAADEARALAARGLLSQGVRFARDESLRTGNPHGVRVDAAAGRVRVFRVDTGASPAGEIHDVRDPLSKRLWDFTLEEDAATRGVSVSLAMTWRGACNVDTVIVFRDGATPSCLDPLATLLDAATLSATRGAHAGVVRVEGFVAQVSLQ